MKKIFIIIIVTALIFVSFSLYSTKGKLSISSNTKGAYLYINDKKKAKIGDGFIDMFLQEGNYTIKIEKLSLDGEWKYIAIQSVFVGDNTFTEIILETSKLATQKRKNRLEQERLELEKIEKIAKNKKLVFHMGKYYNIITSPHTKRKWLDRNLGASRVCISYSDDECYGDYFQWGRRSDGHEKENSFTTSMLSLEDYPSHSKFIKARNSPYDWRMIKNKELWQSASDNSNACPKGFRVPSIDELLSETTAEGVKNNIDAYNNFLKLPSAGNRSYNKGSIGHKGSEGAVWTSSTSERFSLYLYFYSKGAYMNNYNGAYGYSVRCILD